MTVTPRKPILQALVNVLANDGAIGSLTLTAPETIYAVPRIAWFDGIGQLEIQVCSSDGHLISDMDHDGSIRRYHAFFSIGIFQTLRLDNLNRYNDALLSDTESIIDIEDMVINAIYKAGPNFLPVTDPNTHVTKELLVRPLIMTSWQEPQALDGKPGVLLSRLNFRGGINDAL